MTKKSSNTDPVELDLPEGVDAAEQSVEMIRAWIADGALLVALNADAFGARADDWGRMFGELAHHVARASKLNGHMAEHEALQAIQQGFEATLRTGQPGMTGTVRGRVNH